MKWANLCFAAQNRLLLTSPIAVVRFPLQNYFQRTIASYVHCPGVLPLSGATVGQLIQTAAQKWPTTEALFSAHQEIRLTFQDVHIKSDQLAVSFIRLGMTPGDRIGIWAANCVEWYLTQMAAAKAGLLLVTINPLYEANELRECLRKVQATALVYGDKVKNRRMHDILAQVAPDLERSGDGGVTTWHVDSLKNCIAIGADPHKVSVRFNDLLMEDASNAAELLAKIEENIQPDDACNIQFTSGTTGTPKAAVLSHHNIVNNSFLIGSRFNFKKTGSDSICMPNPLFHAFGCVIGTLVALSHGIKLVLPSPLPNAKDTLKALKTEKCSIVYGTPTMHIDLLNEMAAQGTKKSDVNVKLAITAGAFCPAEIYRRIRKNMADFVCTCYGMTECSPVNFQSAPYDDEDTLDVTVGKICDHWEAKVVDSKGKAVPFGKPGELWVRGYGTMLGYWQDAKANANTLTLEGWLKTGDQFVLDERGYGKVVGRIKELIIRGGENIYPGEVEDVLQTHPSIDEAQVIGIPDERLGEIVCAALKMSKNKTLDKSDILKFCKGKVSRYKIPEHVVIVDDFPKTATGKIQKFQLRENVIELLKHSTKGN